MPEQLIEVPEEVIELKLKLISILDGEMAGRGIVALSCCLAEIIATTAPSYDDAMEAVAKVSISIGASISAFQEDGLCAWQEETLQ